MLPGNAALPDPGFVLPLSTGGSAMMFLRGNLVAFQYFAFGPLFVLDHLPAGTGLALVALWLLGALRGLAGGWKRRASDLVLGPDTLSVRGGPLHGKRIAFRDLDPRWFALLAGSGEDRAMLLFDDGVVAVCRDEDEQRSLAAVVATVHALAAQAKGARLPRPSIRPPVVVCCEACGAPVAQGEGERGSCAHCGRTVPTPAAVRARLAARAELTGAHVTSERLLRALVRQRGARQVNLLLFTAVPPFLLGLPLAGLIHDAAAHPLHQPLLQREGLRLFLVGQTVTYALAYLLRATIERRVAMRVVATRFAAFPPEAPGKPCSCRHCGGPLREAGAETLVVHCVYCGSENVLGTHLVQRRGSRLGRPGISTRSCRNEDPGSAGTGCSPSRQSRSSSSAPSSFGPFVCCDLLHQEWEVRGGCPSVRIGGPHARTGRRRARRGSERWSRARLAHLV
jgi:hypothetical protein